MALTLTDPMGQYLVSIGMKVGVPTYGGPDYYPLIVDPIPWSLMPVCIPFGVYPCNALVSAFEDRGVNSQEVLRTKTQDRSYDGNADWRRYGAGLSGWSSFIRLLSGEAISFSPENEHETVHLTYHGRVFPSHISEIPFATYPTNYVYVASPYVGSWSNPVDSAQFDSFMQGLNALYGENGVGGYSFRFAAVGGGTDNLPGIPFDWWYTAHQQCAGPFGRTFLGNFVGYPLASTVSGLKRKRTGTGWRITYSLSWVIGAGEFICNHDISIDISHVSDLPVPDHHFAGGASSGVEVIPTHHPVHVTYSDVVTSAYGTNQVNWFGYTGRLPGSEHSFSYENWTAVQQLETPYSAEFGKDVRTGARLSALGHSALLPSFTKMVEADIQSIRTSSFISSSDGFSRIIGAYNQDLIQTLVKMQDLSSVLPSLTEAWLAVQKLKGGDVIGGVGSLIDFLTSLHLQANFSWRPEFDLLVKYGPQMSKTISLASRIVDNESIVARGSFSFDFPFGTFGRSESSLLARSRIELSPFGRRALGSVLGLRAVGLLPSPSVAWDLLPFSFVVNWFTGIGKRIQDIENMTLLSLLGVERYTHSYLISSPLTDDEMETFGLESSPESDLSEFPSLRVFIRDVSSLMPLPRDSNFDFRMPPALPNWLVPGSLLWQVLS